MNETHRNPNIFERITGEAVKTAANKTQGAASPSGVDSYACMAPLLFILQKCIGGFM